MDMTPHDDRDDDQFAVHAALAEAVVKLLCVSLLPLSQEPAEHHADMMTALDLVALKTLQHNFKPDEVAEAIDAMAMHARHVADMLCHCARAAGVDCEVHVDFKAERIQ